MHTIVFCQCVSPIILLIAKSTARLPKSDLNYNKTNDLVGTGCDLYLITRYCARILTFPNSGDNFGVNLIKALIGKGFINLRRYYVKVAPL